MMKKVVAIVAALCCAALLAGADPAETKAETSMPGMTPETSPPAAAPAVRSDDSDSIPAPSPYPWTGGGAWPGYGGQDAWAAGTAGMGGMGGCPMMGMGGMAGMGGTAGLPTGGMLMTPQAQGLSMNMDQGAALQNLIQLLTLQDILGSLLDLAEAQERALAAPTDAERQSLSRELAAIREQIQGILRENRAQISGR